MSFTHPQQAEIESVLANSPGGVVLQMPTGSGKTYQASRLVESALAGGQRVIFVTPLKAMAEELKSSWELTLKQYKVGVYTGDYASTELPVAFHEADLLVMTPERLDACTRFWRNHWGWIPSADLLIIDEIHLLGDGQRGARLEGAISRYRRLNPYVRLVCLSATLGGGERLAQWLQAEHFQSGWRPVPLDWKLFRYKKAADKPSRLKWVLSQTPPNVQSIVFVQSRRRAESLAVELQQSKVCAAHHHAGMPIAERQKVEHEFRSNQLAVLVATPTLEMGVNLPAGQVVLYDLQRYDGQGFSPISVVSAWQRAGRAGRPGLDNYGRVVVLAPTWDKHAENYSSGSFEALLSPLVRPALLAEQIVAEVASGFAKSQAQLERCLRLYYVYQQGQTSRLSEITQKMIEAKMLVEERDEEVPEKGLQLRATRLGRIASRHLLRPDTVLTINKVFEEIENLTLFDIVLVACATPDCEPTLPIAFEDLDQLNQLLSQQYSMMLNLPAQALSDYLGVSGKRLISALGMATILMQSTEQPDRDALAKDWGCYSFEIQRLLESALRLLQGMRACVEVETDDEQNKELGEHLDASQRIRIIESMLSSGLNIKAAQLTLIDGLGPKLAQALVQAGIDDLEELSLCSDEELQTVPGIGALRSQQWREAAEGLIEHYGSVELNRFASKVTLPSSQMQTTVDPYRFLRAKELTVRGPLDGRYRVSGGADPHVVGLYRDQYRCDCPDFADGNQCKHIMAVKLKRRDKELIKFAKELSASSGDMDDLPINLKTAWMQGTTIKETV